MVQEYRSRLAFYVDEIRQAVVELSGCHQKLLSSKPLIAFRGEPRDYGGTRLTPSLFREDGYVEKESHLFELFCDYNIVSRTASNIEKAIETQHYASISRMLDISFDILVALYFACIGEENQDCNGFVYVFAFPEHYSPHSKYIEDFYTGVLDGKHIAYSRNFKVFSHSHTNERINAQKGGFIFFPGKEFYPISSCYYKCVPISREDKAVILSDLELLFQINEATIFPQKDKIAEAIKVKFAQSTYIPQEVSIKNEIKSVFARIDYELKIERNLGYKTRKDILRWLRKEEDDLIAYVSTMAKNEHCDELLKQIIRDFKILQIRYKEVYDGK